MAQPAVWWKCRKAYSRPSSSSKEFGRAYRFDTFRGLRLSSLEGFEGTRPRAVFSFSHLAIIFLIALLVFGPEKLPEIARQIGKLMGDFRRASTDFRRVVEQEFAEIERQTREKEEQARQKALEAASPAPAQAGTAAAAAESASAPAGLAASEPAALPASGSAGTVANTAAKDSGFQLNENVSGAGDRHAEGTTSRSLGSGPTDSASTSDGYPA